jgi:hypothetical protein
MEDKFVKIILLTVLFCVFGYITTMVYANVHEDVHVAIYNAYGVNSTKTINYISGQAYTQTNGNYSSCTERCVFSHNLNEIIGYNAALFIFTICVLTFIVFLSTIIFSKPNETKREKIIQEDNR